MEVKLGRNRLLKWLGRSRIGAFVIKHEEAEEVVVLAVGLNVAWTIAGGLFGAGVAAAAITVGGVDLSNNNGSAATRVIGAPQVSFVIAKASEGVSFRDPVYPVFRAAARAQGKPFGAYMFLQPAQDARAQADFFLAYAKPRPGDIQPVVDSEVGTPYTAADATLAALVELKAKGYRPILYTSSYWLGVFAEVKPAILQFRIWEAEWGPRLSIVAGSKPVIWQFTGSGHVDGLLVDQDRLLVKSVKQIEIPKRKLTPAQKKAKQVAARKKHLRSLHGFFAWFEWLHARSRWHGLKPREHDARPAVRRHIPKAWWHRNHWMLTHERRST